ncbi:hypothetical protein SADUNF_Sadunf04G0100000 [Salix dunnii]|uniref:Uncharacterized protein n=1 Tax=Salix dunnii TaxID=1413687 RepID=A0A835KEA2_9ROSI|nr:hypothetical protein SADUNF_Sadunf04G0100000 [Salix dunnii]
MPAKSVYAGLASQPTRKAKLNELYADLSNEIESEDFLKCLEFGINWEATYPFYCMELGVIRDLQGQATAKSGASKQSSSFLKATTMTLYTISGCEKACYVGCRGAYGTGIWPFQLYVYVVSFDEEATYPLYCMELGVIRVLQGQATAKSGDSQQSSSFLNATTMTLFTISESQKASYVDQIYSYLGDHPFLNKLINIVVPGRIDGRAVNIRSHGLGCTVVKIRTQDLVEGRICALMFSRVFVLYYICLAAAEWHVNQLLIRAVVIERSCPGKGFFSLLLIPVFEFVLSLHASTNVSRVVSRRDMATQMIPVGSNHSSPTRKPPFPNSTPSALPTVELQSVDSSKTRALIMAFQLFI